MKIGLQKPLGFRLLKSFFIWDAKWCFDASWGLKGLSVFSKTKAYTALISLGLWFYLAFLSWYFFIENSPWGYSAYIPHVKGLKHIVPIIVINIFSRTLDVKEKKHHIPVVDRTPLEPPPVLIAVVGPPKVGKTTLISCLVKNFTRQRLSSMEGPVTIVSGT